jgi:hypothetical protein
MQRFFTGASTSTVPESKRNENAGSEGRKECGRRGKGFHKGPEHAVHAPESPGLAAKAFCFYL